MSAKKVLDDVFSKPVAALIWTANTLVVLPVTTQNFSVGAVLPVVLYMFRWGHRRGSGLFRQTFGPGSAKPSIFYVAGKLTDNNPDFVGFDSDVKKNILGDLLLCYALENKGHKEGQDVELQRVFPTHYMSSWIDLPYSVAHLRFVPEMLVALLAEQREGTLLEPSTTAHSFSVNRDLGENLLLRIFGRGVSVDGPLSNMTGDTVSENEGYAVDQLLTIRLAQMCGQAPERLRGAGAVSGIPNSWSVAQTAALSFRDDISAFLQVCGRTIPRLTLVPMLESMIGNGLLNIFLGCMASAIHWQQTGELPVIAEQRPWPLFVDASSGTDHQLRRLSEESMETVCRLVGQAQTALMCIRVMDAKGRFDHILKHALPTGPDSSEWLNLLGRVRLGRHERSAIILNDLREKCESLAAALETAELNPEVVEILRLSGGSDDPVVRLADGICTLLGDKNQRQNYLKFMDCCLLVDQPHGLGRKRRVPLRHVQRHRSTGDVRSIVLSNVLLDALVHRHLGQDAGGKVSKTLSYSAFLHILRERYGFHLDQAPPGMSISNEDLRRNRLICERRLRDLGLLIGVNDAESMKRLRARYLASDGGSL